jgi:hypothetical protein
MDWRHSSAAYRTSGDCGVVHVQLADTDSDATPIGDWIKIYAYYNDYDQQRYDFWTNCMFDPTDDGNTEDDFFDPEDPYRRLGPSSTCWPEFSFSNAGDTDADYSGPHITNNAWEPDSGLPGLTGTGTWIESRFNLGRFRGRRLRLRFLTTALKVDNGENWEAIAGWNPGPWDDGWWIDDIQVKDALASFAVISNDDKDNSALPGCGSTCDSVTPDLVTDPGGTLAAPGQVVELDASGSAANRCVGGTLQYRFWLDEDGDTFGGGATDTLLRGWTDNPTLVQAPTATSTYVVDVRCSTDPTCAASAYADVPVNCPSSGLGLFTDLFAYPGFCEGAEAICCESDAHCPGSCTLPDYDHDDYGTICLSWGPGSAKGPPRRVSTVRLDDGGKANGYWIDEYWPDQEIKGFKDNKAFEPNGWWWYLMKYADASGYCNQPDTWQTSVGAEPERDEELP